MILKNISIINFKNIKSANLELSPKINCLIGHNGMGKTNFLDAIYYLSFCRSAYNSIDSQIITHDEPFFMLEGNYDNDTPSSAIFSEEEICIEIFPFFPPTVTS